MSDGQKNINIFGSFMERFNCHRSVTPAPHFVACPQSAVI